MLTGIFSTLCIPETKGKTLEELSNEDQDGFVSGVNEVRVNKEGLIVTAA
jgi:MFS transporter, PHS family, inorganic phosphate transporter